MNWILSIVLIFIAVPVGFLIAYLCKDELIQGRKWFKVLRALGITIGIVFIVLGNYAIALTCFFIAIVSGISYWKSFDKKWTKVRKA